MFIGPRSLPPPPTFSGESHLGGDPCLLIGIGEGSAVTTVDYFEVFKKHYKELGRYVATSLTSAPPNACSAARSKLTTLTTQQCHELSTDVYDELLRRKKGKKVPFLPAKKGFHPKRNHGRQQLATLPTARFQDLCGDIQWLLAQRYTELKDDPPGKGSAACNYDGPHSYPNSADPANLYDDHGQPKCLNSTRSPSGSKMTSNLASIGLAKGSGVLPLVWDSDIRPDVRDMALGCFTVHPIISYPAKENVNQVIPDTDISSVAPWTSINPEDLTDLIIRDGVYPVHGGSHADVFCGTLSKNGRSTKVAVKVIRSHTHTEANQRKIDKRLTREMRLWSCLRHPNIVQLLGTTMGFGPYTAMVSPWMEEGNLSHYLNKRKPELNLRRRLQILTDVVEGLSYLHAHSVIHGDLTSGNILMDDRKAYLADFGLSNVMAEFRTNSFMSSNVACAPRWAAPELYSTRTGPNTVAEVTTHCDVYSFGSVALQVISGRPPYGDIVSDFIIIIEVIKGRNPRRPVEPLLSDGFWNLIILCWNQDPRARPAIGEVRERLHVLQDSCSQEALAANIVDD